MWLLLLKDYWQQLAIVIVACVTVAYFHHSWYSAGYSASQAKINQQYQLDISKLEQERDKAFASLHKAEQSLGQEKAAKNRALEEASKTPKVLVKVVHDEKDCPVATAGPDFERVWNQQSKAAAPAH